MRIFPILLIFLVLAIIVNYTFISNSYAQNTVPNQRMPHLLKVDNTPDFHLPIDCTIGENCWIMNYVDMGVDDGAYTDPACYNRTYENHKGTDFALLDGVTMEQGVNVIAPMDGTVKKVRDGQKDMWPTKEQLDDIREKRIECGNAILIDHGNDLKTIYCHLKQDSIIVSPGQKVSTGDVLGQVGLSGLTEFPHLHFGITRDKKVIDPFTGYSNTDKCGRRKKSLWHKDVDLSYQPIAIQSVGFHNNIPELLKLERENTTQNEIAPNAKLLTFSTILLGVRAGDEITLEIRDPNGKIFAENKIFQQKTRAQQFYYTGKKMRSDRLIEGAYTGQVKIKRILKNGKTITRDKISSVLVAR
jgi:hypothetical protein